MASEAHPLLGLAGLLRPIKTLVADDRLLDGLDPRLGAVGEDAEDRVISSVLTVAADMVSGVPLGLLAGKLAISG